MSIEFEDDKIPFIDLGKGYKIRLEYEDLTDEKYMERAREELRETPENVENGIAELRKLIKGMHNSRLYRHFQMQIGNIRQEVKTKFRLVSVYLDVLCVLKLSFPSVERTFSADNACYMNVPNGQVEIKIARVYENSFKCIQYDIEFMQTVITFMG